MESKLTDLENNGYFRLGTVIAGAVFCITSAFLVGGWMSGIANKIDGLQMQLVDMREAMEVRTSDRWRRADMANWCRETELTNKAWHCGAVEGSR